MRGWSGRDGENTSPQYYTAQHGIGRRKDTAAVRTVPVEYGGPVPLFPPCPPPRLASKPGMASVLRPTR